MARDYHHMSAGKLMSTAYNSVHKVDVIAAQYTPDGDLTITVNGEERGPMPALIDEMGFKEAWDFVKDTGAAYDAKSDVAIQKGKLP